MSPRSLQEWTDRLVFLETEQATAVGADEKFALLKKIEEARRKIDEISNRPDPPEAPTSAGDASRKPRPTTGATQLKVVVSSTVSDLQEHRRGVLDACLRQGMFPLMTEHQAATADDLASESTRRVDEASIYLGIFGHRYGDIPAWPRRLDHRDGVRPRRRARPAASGLPDARRAPTTSFGRRPRGNRGTAGAAQGTSCKTTRPSPFSVRQTTCAPRSSTRSPATAGPTSARSITFATSRSRPRPTSPIPILCFRPASWSDVRRSSTGSPIGSRRRAAETYDARVLCVVAIGGMGKSALTWKWFNEIAPYEMTPLKGRLWWSFYESDATFENFVIRALAYVRGAPRTEIQRMSIGEREDELLNILDREPFLLALDGLERILVAYARPDAARLPDDDLDEETRNFIAASGETMLPSETRHPLRKTTDPRAGNFLRKLSRLRASRVLISSRLYPAALQTAHRRRATGRQGPSPRRSERRGRPRPLAGFRCRRYAGRDAAPLQQLRQLSTLDPGPGRRGGAISPGTWRLQPLARGTP